MMMGMREKLIELLREVQYLGGLEEKIADHLIDNGVTIPVRCKDCIGKAHWYKNDYGCTICGLSGLYVVEDRDFCSYGERKEA